MVSNNTNRLFIGLLILAIVLFSYLLKLDSFLIILILQIVMMRVENPKPWRHLFNIYEGRLSRFRVPHAHYTHPETIKEVFIDKVRIDNGFTREEFEMLAPSKIEELLKDPILIRFIINNEKNMTLSEVEQAIKRWKK